jgi:hypothetical protein
MKNCCNALLGTVVTAWLAATAAAHPGHGVTESTSVAHYVVEPLHAAPWLAALAALFGCLAWRLLRRRSAV